tara:strand:- start:44 stop:448 length:405 start_codon:yes stop_codon:yes gene_type:complete
MSEKKFELSSSDRSNDRTMEEEGRESEASALLWWNLNTPHSHKRKKRAPFREPLKQMTVSIPYRYATKILPKAIGGRNHDKIPTNKNLSLLFPLLRGTEPKRANFQQDVGSDNGAQTLSRQFERPLFCSSIAFY